MDQKESQTAVEGVDPVSSCFDEKSPTLPLKETPVLPAASTEEPKIYVTLEDLTTIQRNMKSMKDALNESGETYLAKESWLSSLGGTSSYKGKIIGKKQVKKGTTSWGKIKIENGSSQPRYSVYCCEKRHNSATGLFAHLRKFHKVGVSDKVKKCKICGQNVSEDMQMLHYEFFHEQIMPRELEITFETMEIEGNTENVMSLDSKSMD